MLPSLSRKLSRQARSGLAAASRILRPCRSAGLAIPAVSLLLIGGGFASVVRQQQPYGSRNPHGPIQLACENCHTATSWSPIRPHPDFDHKTTAYPLRGMHRSVGCRQCHVDLVFSKIGTECSDCHADIHRRQLGSKCEQCHTVRGWQISMQSVNEHQNRFPLLGAHAEVGCESCHTGAAVGLFRGLNTACISCHMSAFQNAKLPDHVAAGLPSKCELCHGMDSWFGAKFDHAKFTNFPLTGLHAQIQCTACHPGARFTGTPTACYGCHAADYAGASPDHVKAGFGRDCSLCHSTANWSGASFNHSSTGFALTGVHATLTCTQCHTNNQYAGTPAACVGCHLNDYNATNNPNHKTAGFSTDCGACHTTASWLGAVFDHSKTVFPLTGAHVSVACVNCHANNQYLNAPTQCIGCHLNDYNTATNPNHAAAGFPQDCTLCHTTTSFQGATFNHSSTGFVLTGVHATLTCSQCHLNNQFAGTPATCIGCHQKDYDGTNNPNHAQAGFPTDCSVCHSTTDWTGAVFDHSKTRFPLTGAHTSLKCLDCHASGAYATLPTTCITCHQADFNNTTNPNHVAAGFPTDCSICHTTTTFSTATFNHSTTSFPLTGAHVSVSCLSCHINNVFAGTPTDCYSCHSADYKGTTNPNHTAAGFPTSCQTCHSTATWAGAVFNHTYFPQNHGNARTCSDCHPNSNDYSIFQCTNCHTQAQTNGQHGGVRGYVYNSVNCYQCHPTGRGGQ